MLTTQSYAYALVVYISAGIIALTLAHRFWFKVLPLWAARLLTGALAGLLLAPARTSPEDGTWAPALIVGVFNGLFGEGWASAVHAFGILILASGLGILLAIASLFLFNVKQINKES